MIITAAIVGGIVVLVIGYLYLRMDHWRTVAEEQEAEREQLLTAALAAQREYGQVNEQYQFFRRNFEQFCNKPVQAILHDAQFAAMVERIEAAVRMEMIDKAVCPKCQTQTVGRKTQ